MTRLNDLGILVVILGSTPRHTEAVPTILAKRMLRHDINALDDDTDTGSPWDSDRYLASRYATKKDVIYISAKRALCSDRKCVLTVRSGIPIQWDRDHFTADGENFAIERMFDEQIRALIFNRLALGVHSAN